MPTIHFRRNKEVVTLTESEECIVSSLIAELAEVLISTKLANQDEVAELRLGIEDEDDFVDITESTAALKELQINEYSVICYKFGKDSEFKFDNYTKG